MSTFCKPYEPRLEISLSVGDLFITCFLILYRKPCIGIYDSLMVADFHKLLILIMP